MIGTVRAGLPDNGFTAVLLGRREGRHPAWHGMAWHGMAWHGMAWHGMGVAGRRAGSSDPPCACPLSHA
jgi:hypothetical protein